ncbi:antigen 5 like allergen Cul n 1-like [Episyrphus balteatus]|uniref:antigen 5 like allergen Cul n 1-like n=1 Tax=Episyrphus balteatus TaxID=286459 RepID=UPI002486500C|nr:antigen 5 like allergen Cul n 1-like [Episyrphus balteatus]
MKSVELFLVLIGFVGYVASQATSTSDYCDPSLCYGSPHTGCNNTMEFAADCVEPEIVPMDEAHKKAIVDMHNTYRNSIASGNMTGFNPCPRMATMQWNEELAFLAMYNTRTCVYAHDQCHNTKQFPSAGQNIGMNMQSTKHTDSNINLSKSVVTTCWNEYKDASMKDINSYPPNPPKVVGHFTQMCIEKSNGVGCHAVKFRNTNYNNMYTYYLVCNYAKIFEYYGQIYSSGPTASKCKTGTNPNYKGLCSVNEVYEK